MGKNIRRNDHLFSSMSWRVLCVICFVLLFASGSPAASGSHGAPGRINLEVYSNEELLEAANINGWPGTGAPDDPIIIENEWFGNDPAVWHYDFAHSVLVENTDLHVVFKKVKITDGSMNNRGLFMVNVANMTFDDIRVEKGGFTIHSARDSLVNNSYFAPSFITFWCGKCSNVTTQGIDFGGARVDYKFGAGNRFVNNSNMRVVYEGEQNHVYENNRNGGFSASRTSGVFRNSSFSSIIGVDDSKILVENNTILPNRESWGQHANAPRGYYAMSFSGDVEGTVVAGNIFQDRVKLFIFTDYSGGAIIYDNVLSGIISYAGERSAGSPWPDESSSRLHCSELCLHHFSIEPRPGTNIVGGDTIGGNYWGPDFPTPDDDGDGFGDIPYPSLRPDEYPLVLPS